MAIACARNGVQQEVTGHEARRMTDQRVSLNDKYDLEKTSVLLNGTQALVRLMLMQKRFEVLRPGKATSNISVILTYSGLFLMV